MQKNRRPCDEEILAAMNRIERDMIKRGDRVPDYYDLHAIAVGHLKARSNFDRMTQKEVK